MSQLVIRDAQRPALRAVSLQTFRERMVEHLFAFSPQHCAGIGEAAVQEVVALGIERSAQHGFSQRGPVRLYLEMMLLMGSHFDTDPQLPLPMADLLRDRDKAAQLDRADRLHGELLRHMRQALGRANRHARAAIDRLRTMSSSALELRDEHLERDVLRVFGQVYPERFALAGPAALALLVARARALAAAESLDLRRGTALTGLLMFELGHRCFEDPLYPWLARALLETRGQDPVARTEHLEAKAKTYLALIARRLERGVR